MKKLFAVLLFCATAALAQPPPSGSQTTKNTNGAFNNLYAKTNGSAISVKDTAIFTKVTLWKGQTSTVTNPGTDTCVVYFRQSDGTLRIRYSDGTDHNLDSMGAASPWTRNSDGSVRLTTNTDSVVIGQTTFNRYFNAKTEIAVNDNGKWGLAFVGDSGSSVNLPFMAGRLNNANYWQLKHYGSFDRIRFETFNSGVTTNYWELSNTGMSVNGVPLDVFTVYGNTSIGNFTSTMSGGTHLRVKNFIYGGYSNNEANDQSNHVLGNTSATQDVLDLESTTTTDSSTGGHEKYAHRNLLFTSSSAQSMFTVTISQLVTYQFDVTLLENPSGVDSGYFSKKIYCTARNKAGTIFFDTTTAFMHNSTTSSSFPLADLVVSASGNTLTFSAKGSATRQCRAEMYITRRFIK